MKNRKNKITNLLKIGILLFGISLLLWNCEKEEINIKPENNLESKTPFRVATFESIVEKKEFKQLIEKSKIKPFFEKNTKGQYLGKNNSNEIDYIVVKETVKIIELENYTSYTFLVENNDNTTHNFSFINLVIEKNEENINAFLIKYNPSKEFLLSKNMPFSGELSIKSVNYDKTLLSKQQNPDCGWVENYTLRNCTEHGTSGIYNRACDNYGKDAFAYSTSYVCGYGGGSSFSQLSYFSNDNYGGGSSSPSTNNTSTQTAPVFPCGDQIHGCSRTANKIASKLNLTEKERLWLNEQDENFILDLETFLLDNNYSIESKLFVKSALEILSLKELSPTNNIDTFKSRILKMTKHLKDFGNPEDEFFANYVESIIPDFSSMLVGDVYDIYSLTRSQVHNLTGKYLEAIVVPFAEAAYPFIVYALTEATLGAALPILAKIPKLPVLNTAWVSSLVKQIGTLGVRGDKTYVRIVTTNGNAYTKALELFKGITRNAQAVTTQSNGIRIANMGNGNFIKFRPANASSGNFAATIDLDFRAAGIWTKIRNVKFQ